MTPQSRRIRRVIDVLIVALMIGIGIRYLAPAPVAEPVIIREPVVQTVETGITPISLYDRAVELRKADNYEGALAVLNVAISEADEPNAWMLGERVWLLNSLERYDEAIVAHEAMIEVVPLNAWRANNYCYSHSSLNNFERAWDVCSEAAALDANNHYARQHLCYIGSYYEHYQVAIDYCTAWIAEEPSDPYPYNNRGRAHLMLGNYAQAIEDITRSIEMENDHPHMTYTNRALAYMGSGEWDLAYADLETAFATDTPYPELDLANAYRIEHLAVTENFDLMWALPAYCSYIENSWITPDEAIFERVDQLGGCE